MSAERALAFDVLSVREILALNVRIVFREHILREHGVPHGRVVYEDMGHRAHQPPVLNDRAAAHALYYAARAREKVSTRAEMIECLNMLLAELKGILSAEDYERLQAIPLQKASRDSLAGQKMITPPAMSPKQ